MINDFLGDTILAIFGAPVISEDLAQQALACAIEMGIALNTSEVVGNIGSERRTEYGVVGHHVNLAARIESFTVGTPYNLTQTIHDQAMQPLSEEMNLTFKTLSGTALADETIEGFIVAVCKNAVQLATVHEQNTLSNLRLTIPGFLGADAVEGDRKKVLGRAVTTTRQSQLT